MVFPLESSVKKVYLRQLINRIAMKSVFSSIFDLLGIFGAVKDFFGDSKKLERAYKFMLAGVILYIVYRMAYIVYRMCRFGCVREVNVRFDGNDLPGTKSDDGNEYTEGEKSDGDEE
jgi:hypothetical protein